MGCEMHLQVLGFSAAGVVSASEAAYMWPRNPQVTVLICLGVSGTIKLWFFCPHNQPVLDGPPPPQRQTRSSLHVTPTPQPQCRNNEDEGGGGQLFCRINQSKPSRNRISAVVVSMPLVRCWTLRGTGDLPGPPRCRTPHFVVRSPIRDNLSTAGGYGRVAPAR